MGDLLMSEERSAGPGLVKWLFIAGFGWVIFSITTCSQRAEKVPLDAPKYVASPAAQAAPAEPVKTERERKHDTVMAHKGQGLIVLKDELLKVCELAAPHYNFIKAQQRGNGLFCVHDFYNQYSLSAGNDAKLIGAFVSEWSQELRHLKIKRVGVYGTGEYASGQWFNVD